MIMQTPVDNHKARALELRTEAFSPGLMGLIEKPNPHGAAQDCAEQQVPGDDIALWIGSGLSDALLQCGRYRDARDMACIALAFCASNRASSALLTMTVARLGLGDVQSTRTYA